MRLLAAQASNGVTWVDVAQAGAAIVGIVIAGLVALMPYARRPRLSIEEDADRSNSRVELSAFGGLPHVRLLVRNAKRRRAAKGTHVLVEGYREQQKPLEKPTTLGHPSLAWPAPDADQTGVVTLFAGGRRPITLGYFIRVRLDERGELLRPVGEALPHYARQQDYDDATPARWYLRLALAFGLDIYDNRDKLPPVPNGYIVRVLVGADDGAARAFEIDVRWNGDGALKPEDVLASALDHLHVREA